MKTMNAFLAWPVAALLFVVSSHVAEAAEPPPDLPLPACEVGGEEVGACPSTNDNVTAAAGGKLTAGVASSFNIDPTLPVCDEHLGYTAELPWSPSPCYSAVYAPVVMGCGYIDFFDDNKWKETSCTNALFRNPADAVFPMFTVTPKPGSEKCGGRGNYQTYIYGGPANVPGAKWVEVGPTTLGCQITFAGPRPDGLYGTTWVKLRFGVDRAQTGDYRRGNPEYAETYVRIDGDLREEVPDVSIIATASVRQGQDQQIVTFNITLSNDGEVEANGVELATNIPDQYYIDSITEDGTKPIDCGEMSNFVGGSLNCTGIDLPAADDPLGRNVRFFEIEARVTNATEAERVVFKVNRVPNDLDPSDNEDTVDVFSKLNFKSGSTGQTRQLMSVLDAVFDYRTDIYYFGDEETSSSAQACNGWRRDVYATFEGLRLQNPQLFANLEYGPITSGTYTTLGSNAGHVGVIVYEKGTNFRESGIVIHGLPSSSPIAFDPELYNTQVADFPLNDPPERGRYSWTSFNGFLYRTPARDFPGTPQQEGAGCGFEGRYSDNEEDFDRPRTCVQPKEVKSCPITPYAVVVNTESPVDLRITNSAGDVLETIDGAIDTTDFRKNIYSIAYPHDDGTYGWNLTLPVDDYVVELIGVGNGPYKLTMSRYYARGAEPKIEEVIHEGTAIPGVIERFEFSGAMFNNGFEPTDAQE